MEFQREKYVIKGNDKNSFNEFYNKIFNDLWYPGFFIKNNFSIYIIKNFEKIGLNNLNYLNIINQLSSLNESNKNPYYFFKTFNVARSFDYSENRIVNIEEYLKVGRRDFTKLIQESSFDELIGSINYGNIDQGLTFFDCSGKWAYYYGEDLYDYGYTGNFEEFELFIINNEIKEDFNVILKNNLFQDFEIDEIDIKSTFKVTHTPNNKLYEIDFLAKDAN